MSEYIAATNSRSCSSGNSDTGMPQMTVPTLPITDGAKICLISKASPSMTAISGKVLRRNRAISLSISTAINFLGGIPEARMARVIAPVPAPSSTTNSPSTRHTWSATSRLSVSDEGVGDANLFGCVRKRQKCSQLGDRCRVPSDSAKVRCSLVISFVVQNGTAVSLHIQDLDAELPARSA